MPNCFRLIDKVTKEPTSLNKVDARMCEYFKVECHPKKWFGDWYNWHGFLLATGKSFEDIIKSCKEHLAKATAENEAMYKQELEITRWLQDNYIAEAWYEPK